MVTHRYPSKTSQFHAVHGGLPHFQVHISMDFPRNAFQLILRNMVRFGVVVSWRLTRFVTSRTCFGIDAQLVMLMNHRGNPGHSDTLHWLDGDHCLNSYRGLLHFPGVARPLLLLLRLPIGVTSEGSKERQLDKVRELKSEAPYFSRIHDIDVLFPLVLLYNRVSHHFRTCDNELHL